MNPSLPKTDLVAPFWKFLRSEYSCTYDWIDNDMSPSGIRLRSSARNSMAGRTLKQFDFTIHLNEKGLHRLQVESGKLNMDARCTD